MVLVLSGCGAQVFATLQEEWDVTVEQQAGTDLRVVDFLPADGIIGVAHRSSPYFLFNRPMTPDERSALGSLVMAEMDGGGSFTFEPVVDFDDAAVSFGEDRLNRPEDYSIDVPMPIPEGAFHSVFATDEAPGVDFNMAANMTVEKFGGSTEHAATLGSLFTPESPLWLGKVTGLGDSLPATIDIALAVADGGRTGDHPFYIQRYYGYITRFADVVVGDDGRFSATLDGAFLPLWLSGDPMLLRLTPITIRGRFTVGGGTPTLSDFEFEGVVSTRWLIKLADQPDPWPRLLDILALDVDLNGNGVDDSATIHLVSQPALVPRDQIDFG